MTIWPSPSVAYRPSPADTWENSPRCLHSALQGMNALALHCLCPLYTGRAGERCLSLQNGCLTSETVRKDSEQHRGLEAGRKERGVLAWDLEKSKGWRPL